MSYNADKIRSINPLSVQMEKYGIKPDRKGFARCPFHNEKTASFKLYADNTFHCFGCGAHGDVISFVMMIENISFNDACRRLDGDISYSEQRKIDRIRRERNNKSEFTDKARSDYWQAFENWKNNETVIELFKPEGPDAEPAPEFLTALKYRGYFSYLLDLAENKCMKGV